MSVSFPSIKKPLVLAGALALATVLAGCNGPGGLNLAASANGDQPDVYALANPKGITGPGANVLEEAKKQYREQNFGLAEQQFRAIVEKEPANAEAWLGLAAAYDQLRRFELADRAYGQVSKIAGESVALHNNRGYSYVLRGDRRKARAEFLRAQRLDPQNDFVRNNLKALSRRG